MKKIIEKIKDAWKKVKAFFKVYGVLILHLLWAILMFVTALVATEVSSFFIISVLISFAVLCYVIYLFTKVNKE